MTAREKSCEGNTEKRIAEELLQRNWTMPQNCRLRVRGLKFGFDFRGVNVPEIS
jgi:hypothetical protein